MKQWWIDFYHRNRQAVFLLYFLIYLPWFYLLERAVVPEYWIHTRLDDWIPFCEYFVIPYLFWFAYVALAMVFFYRRSRGEFSRLCLFLFTGMTICLILYGLFPNGHHLRPWRFEHSNAFTELVRLIYMADSCTNVCPSIHTLNSIGVQIAVWRSPLLRGRPWVRYGSLAVCVSIILSTVFLKQHSVLDVFTAAALACPLYVLAYRVDWPAVVRRWQEGPRPRLERTPSDVK